MKFRIFQNPLFISMATLIVLFSCNNEDTPTAPIQPVVTKFTIATSTGVGGSVTSSQSVDGGQSATVTATAQEHYQLKQWTGDCGSFGSDNSEITITASKNCQIGAEFEKIKYSITAGSTDGGSVSEGELSREYGQIASFTAEPEEGYQLSGWTPAEGSECPDLIAVNNKVTFTVAGNCSLEAVFSKAPRTITIEENENGEIGITPSETVDHGDEVVVTATANEHYTFKSWSGSCGELNNDESSIVITLVSDCTLGAVFEKVNYTITAISSEGGSVFRDGQQVDEELSIVYGETSTLTATPDKGYQFSEWRSDDCPALEDATDVEAEFVVEGDCRLEAVFEKAPRMISATENENGQITISPSEGVVYGDEVSVTATADEHYAFKGWSGDCGDLNDDESSLSITVLEDCTIEAEFEKVSYTIIAISSEGGSVTNEDSETGINVVYGETITLTATAEEGYQFSVWTTEGRTSSANCPTLASDTDPVAEFVVEGNCRLEAVFEKAQYTISASLSDGGSVSDAEGQSLGGDDSLTKEHGQTISLTATPDEGYVFDRWETIEDTDCPVIADASDPELEFSIEGNCGLSVLFSKAPRTITIEENENGQIMITPSENLVYGDEVEVTARANEHYAFQEWVFSCGEEDSPDIDVEKRTISFIATKDCAIKAVFTEVLYSITAEGGTGGSVDSDEEERGFGQEVRITAEPDDGYEFDRWRASGSGCPDDIDLTNEQVRFDVGGDCSLEALFTEVESSGGGDDQDDDPTTNQPTDTQTTNTQPTTTTPTNQPTTNQPTTTTTNQPTTTQPTAACPSGTDPLYEEDGIIKARDCARSLIGQRVLIDPSDQSSQKYLIADTAILNSEVRRGSNLQYVNTTFVNSMWRLFRDNTTFNDDISKWDVSNVAVMSHMFSGATMFDQNIGSWDVSNVKYMDNMFNGAIAFNQELEFWDVSNVTNMRAMFKDATALVYPVMDDWNVSKVEDMSFMFQGATKFGGGLGRWEVSSVVYMEYMFNNAAAYHDFIDDWNVSNVTNMEGMFYKAYTFTGGENMGEWDVSNVTNMQYMFAEAGYFNKDISGWDVSNVRNMAWMFYEANNFPGRWEQNDQTYEGIGSWDVSNVTNMRSMFQKALSFNGNIGEWDVSNVTNMRAMFYDATGFNQDLSSWNVRRVTDMSHMFRFALSFNNDNEPGISGWNVINVQTMYAMFWDAQGFTQDISSWRVLSVLNCQFFANDFLTFTKPPFPASCN